MCGRFSRYVGERVIEDRFNVTMMNTTFSNDYNIAPHTFQPVIREQSPRSCDSMRWAYTPTWQTDLKSGPAPINVRSDKIETKFFKYSFENHRCLVPASGYYEWRKTSSGKVPYHISVKNQNVFAFAGIYSPVKIDEDKWENRFAIVTIDPLDEISHIHNRMPLILNKSLEASWISKESDLNEIRAILKTPDLQMEYIEVSSFVNSPRNNSELCILPYSEYRKKRKQQDLDSFF